MKVQVWKDERYPDYGLSKSGTSDLVEISDGFYAEYERVNKIYNEMQDTLSELYKNSRIR